MWMRWTMVKEMNDKWDGLWSERNEWDGLQSKGREMKYGLRSWLCNNGRSEVEWWCHDVRQRNIVGMGWYVWDEMESECYKANNTFVVVCEYWACLSSRFCFETPTSSLPFFEISAWNLGTGGEGRGASLNYYEHKTATWFLLYKT